VSAYDVVVAGASFAGLAVAQRLGGRVLVVDPKPVGAG
jgi:2-polyprenyl-6-methoxyphenol hydroxylase-like FAD-dependent oxidoreductase